MIRRMNGPAGARGRRQRTGIHAILLLLATGLGGGCTSHFCQTTVMATREPILPVPETLPVLELNKPSDRPYDIVGKVGYWILEHTVQWDSHKKLIPLASEMGADGLLGVHMGQYPLPPNPMGPSPGQWFWISAVAVKSLDPGRQPEHRSGKFMVGVLPCLGADGETSNIIQKLGQFWLENAGYYAVCHSQGVFDRDLKALESLPPEKLADLCGRHTDLILLSEASDKSSVNMLLTATHKIKLTFQLYSKSERKVVWRDSAQGAVRMGVAARAQMGKQEVFAAAKDAFKSLKVISKSKPYEEPK